MIKILTEVQGHNEECFIDVRSCQRNIDLFTNLFNRQRHYI